ncbi:uncharacterized protein LOC133812993 [Humulus lupulus]|uniref:uncharacterized protein LOC133812993 n=1 Tax=Humulus lupulus TaxID=3486 RepID=UPI002B411378|nr:uncharacterized protein LOC133812993 [Humulus lupulus]
MADRDEEVAELTSRCADLQLLEGEDAEAEYEESAIDDPLIDLRWCLVGRFLVDNPVDFEAMRNMMALLWKPGKGLYVKEIGPNRYLFQRYHSIDLERVLEGSPWTFNKVPLIFARLKPGDIPREVHLHTLDMWVQVHDLHPEFMSERIVRDLGNFIGTFVKSDENNFIGVWREYLRIRVTVDIDVPLKRRKKLKKKAGVECWANFKYEFVPTFCFICGIIGHSERYCPKIFEQPADTIVKHYGLFMKAALKRIKYAAGAKWLVAGSVSQIHLDEQGRSGAGINSVGTHGRGGREIRNPEQVGGMSGIRIHDGGSNAALNGNHKGKNIVPDTGNEGIFQEENEVILEAKRRRTEIASHVESSEMRKTSDVEMGIGVESEKDHIDSSDINGSTGDNENRQEDAVSKNRYGADRIEAVARQLQFEGCFVVDAVGRGGGLALLWKNMDEIVVRGYSHNHIDVEVSIGGLETWRLTGLYGEPNRALR